MVQKKLIFQTYNVDCSFFFFELKNKIAMKFIVIEAFDKFSKMNNSGCEDANPILTYNCFTGPNYGGVGLPSYQLFFGCLEKISYFQLINTFVSPCFKR